MPRGGRRSGSAGKQYTNRSDLQTGPRKLALQTVPGQPYGSQTAQRAALQAVPEASGDITPSGGAPVDPAAVQADADQFSPPPVVPIGAPSQLPSQHVMTPPSASQAPNGPDPLLNGVALLNSLGGAVSPEVKALRTVVSAQQANGAAP